MVDSEGSNSPKNKVEMEPKTPRESASKNLSDAKVANFLRDFKKDIASNENLIGDVGSSESQSSKRKPRKKPSKRRS